MKKIPFLLSLIFGLMILTTSCEKWPIDWDNGGGGSTTSGTTTTSGDNTNCTTYGTLVLVPCGTSDLSDLWILGDDGKYYQPCDASIVRNEYKYMLLEPGVRVLFGFVPIADKKSCNDDRVICLAVPPPHESIKLTCIQQVVKDTVLTICKPIVMGEFDNKAINGRADIISASRSGDCITMVIECLSNQPIIASEINLKLGEVSKSNPAKASLYLDDVPFQETASRIERVTLNFNVSELTQQYPNVRINLQGWNSGL
jgi:hypothetical protein